MSYNDLITISIISYLAASVLILKSIFTEISSNITGEAQSSKNHALAEMIFLAFAFCSHCFLIVQTAFIQGAINTSFSAMSILVAGIIVVVFFIGCLFSPIRKLGVIVYPTMVCFLILAYFWQSEQHAEFLSSYSAASHTVISLLTFAFLALATLQAQLYLFLDKKLKQHALAHTLCAFPPLLTMENLIFRMLWIGFVLLSFSVASGTLFNQQLNASLFSFNHHIVLSVLSWSCLAYTLYKRYFFGLRGQPAVKWISLSFTILALGYFGTKLINEWIQ